MLRNPTCPTCGGDTTYVSGVTVPRYRCKRKKCRTLLVRSSLDERKGVAFCPACKGVNCVCVRVE